MGATSKPKLMLLFTRGISLKIWDAVGMLDRETELYKTLSPALSGIEFLTYGDGAELDYGRMLTGIEILPNVWGLTSTKFSILAPFLLRKQFRKADVIKTNQLDGAWTGVIAKLLFRKKLIVRCGYLWSVFEKNRLSRTLRPWEGPLLLEKICLKLADFCVVAAQADKQYIKAVHGIGDAKIRVVPNYVNTDVFKPLPEVRKEPNLVCFVGRLSRQKGLENLLEACHGLEHVKLLMIGDGELREALSKKANSLNLAIEFHRSVPNHELPLWLNRAQAFVLPSNYEGCPKALLEAMACELPVVGTDVEGIREIIRHGENGILCDRSPDSIRNAILNALNSSEGTKQMAKNAREYVIEHHSLHRIAEMELETIRKCFL